jgi:hypothetical protein
MDSSTGFVPLARKGREHKRLMAAPRELSGDPFVRKEVRSIRSDFHVETHIVEGERGDQGRPGIGMAA